MDGPRLKMTRELPASVKTRVSGETRVHYSARQPILDARGKILAYELLFRSAQEDRFSGESDHATRAILDDAVMFGVDRLTGGLPAFINCTLDALTTDLIEILPPRFTVLEIVETLEPTEELVSACRKLR